MQDEKTKAEVIQEENQKEIIIPVSKSHMETLNISDPAEIVSIAKEINKYVSTNSLSTKIQGKQFVQVEGWQFTGGLLGLVAMIEEVQNVSSYEEKEFIWTKTFNGRTEEKRHKTKLYKYNAKAVFKDSKTGRIVGQGFAMCSNEEEAKHMFDEYAVMSMAQTRAIGKAARMSFSFIIKAAGYEPTPAEEMSDEKEPENNVVVPADIIAKIKEYTSKEDLSEWASSKENEIYHKNVMFKNLVNAKWKEIKAKEDGTKKG